LGELEELYERHRDQVAFFVVYIREAHPEDGWVLEVNREAGIALVDPVLSDERAAAADACVVRLETRIPILVDDIDDAVASAYGGWPDRLYLVGRNGRIAFQGEEGPDGFRPAELAAAIERELGRPQPPRPPVRSTDGDSPRRSD
jgi:Iodothyronine deiodinase